MPAFIDPTKCNRNWDQCFPARVCPESALTFSDDHWGVDRLGSVRRMSWSLCQLLRRLRDHVRSQSGNVRYHATPGPRRTLRVGGVEARQALEAAEAEKKSSASAVLEVTMDNFVAEVMKRRCQSSRISGRLGAVPARRWRRSSKISRHNTAARKVRKDQHRRRTAARRTFPYHKHPYPTRVSGRPTRRWHRRRAAPRRN